jgi:hypothetical protein
MNISSSISNDEISSIDRSFSDILNNFQIKSGLSGLGAGSMFMGYCEKNESNLPFSSPFIRIEWDDLIMVNLFFIRLIKFLFFYFQIMTSL